MKLLKHPLFIVSQLILIVTATVEGSDLESFYLTKITLKNSFQASVVESIAGQAHVRDNNNFWVTLDNHQIQTLHKTGIEYSILSDKFHPQTTYLIYPRQGALGPGTDFSVLGEYVDISRGKGFVSMSRTAAASVAEDPVYFVTLITELEIPFTYLPSYTLNLLAEIDDFPTDSLANLVSQDSLYVYDTRLEAFQTRYIYTDSCLSSRDWIVRKFFDFGYSSVTTPMFWMGGTQCFNVQAVKQGYAEPDKVIVIGGHYDSITFGQPVSPFEFAPGADDNASGVSVVLEMARILADVPLRKTIVFIAFSAEEVGLVGSNYSAQSFLEDGTDLEVMYNYDMVAYDPHGYLQLSMSCGPNASYRDLTINAALRVSCINPVTDNTSPGSSDHAPFNQRGFHIVNSIETDFNYPGWHTMQDLSSNLSFYFLNCVARMTAASLAIVANAAYPTTIDHVVDLGDGQSLEVFWDNCRPDYDYILTHGLNPGNLTDTVFIPSGQCSHIITGLIDGVSCYFSVSGTVDDGYPAIYSVVDSGISYLIPRVPTSLSATPEFQEIIIDWDDNLEADIAGYNLYRSIAGLGFSLYRENLVDSYYEDTEVESQVNYGYKVAAVDLDGNISELTEEIEAYPATFDGGVLLADEMAYSNPVPSQEQQELYFDMLFGLTPYDLAMVEPNQPLLRSVAGRFSSIFWLDGDLSPHLIDVSNGTIVWYVSHPNNMFVSGFGTIRAWTTSPVSVEHPLYTDFGVQEFETNTAFDFAGAAGEQGWPSAVVDPENIFGNLPNSAKLIPREGATVIYTWDSFSDDPAYENQPCGLLYETPNGIRIVLGFPLFFLTESSANAIVTHAKTLFGETQIIVSDGDVDGSGKVDISDLVYLIDYTFSNGTPPLDINAADVNGSCLVDISDITYMVEYLFMSGDVPQPGCVE